jgi:hypothetical protein
MNGQPLSLNQKALLDRLLSKPFPGSEELKKQVADCEAKPTGDDDNYGSVYLTTRSKQPAKVALRVPVEGLVDDSDDSSVDVLLHVVDGFINELEIVKLDGTPLKAELDPTKMRVILNR